MATVVTPIIEPDLDAIKEHLETLFAPARTEYPGGLIELRYGSPEALNNWAYFNLLESGVSEAASFAANRNREGSNVYVGVNPRKPNTPGKRAANTDDVEIAFFHFADIDKPESLVGLVERYGALPPTMTVTTGTVPNKRPHLYWRLEEPVMNMAEWTERQSGIAKSLGGDDVIDPPRIMRLAGTVNYPTQKKLAKGYKMELTSLRTQFPNERCDVTPEQVAATYPRPASEILPVARQSETGSTLRDMARGTRVSDLIAAIQHGDQWHNNMVRLVAHLVGTGRSDAEIMTMAAGLTLPGFTIDQTAREMATAIVGARRKWSMPEPDETVEQEEDRREDAESIFPLLSLDELENMPPPTWLIDGILPEHGLSIVYGDPGAGKSFVVLDMALRIAFGMDWHGQPAKQSGVLYIAGEGKHGLGKRVTGWRKQHYLEGTDAPFKLLPVAVHMLDKQSIEKLKRTIEAAQQQIGFPIGLVIIDTVSRAIPGQDENKQEAMSLFIDGCAEIQNFTQGALIGVHHAGKDKEKGMRGSTVLLGGCDASMKVTKTENIATINIEKQKDAEEAEPIYLTMEKVAWVPSGFDKEETTLVPVKTGRPIDETENRALGKDKRVRILDEITSAWEAGKPWSSSPQTRSVGRYLPQWMAREFDTTVPEAASLIEDWLLNGILEVEIYNNNSKAKGLRVVAFPEDWRC